MSLCVYGEICRDWLVDSDTFIRSRWGGAGLYASLAAARQGYEVNLLTLYGPDLEKYYMPIWQFLGVNFNLADYRDNYIHHRYLVTGFKNFQHKISRPMVGRRSGHRYNPEIPLNCEGILLFPIDHSLPKKLCKEAKDKGLLVLLDPKPNENSLADAKEILPYVDFLLVNEEEAKLISEKEEMEQVVNELRKLINGYAIIKCGHKGAYIISENDIEHVPSYKAKAVCTLGSGDVFGGAFFSTYMRTKDIKYSVKVANCVAACFIEQEQTEGVINQIAAEKEINTRNLLRSQLLDLSIYLAGPFFSKPECDWLKRVCEYLETSGLNVHSPSRENGIIRDDAPHEERKKVYEADIVRLSREL
ncbi:MAG: hypothetical protein FH756_18555 [Firmicutes bacterium]|nr:hypothetical protein [Bacillota bacterium]